jgi:enediyne biosynthesis protein E4
MSQNAGLRVLWIVGAGVGLATLPVCAGTGSIAPFTREATARGVNYVMVNAPQPYGYLGFGCAFADLDNDGDDDIIVVGNAAKTAGVFENDGLGFFTERSLASGIPTLTQASGIACADFDGDGDLDINFTQLADGNVLVRNEGGFVFTPVSAAAGTTDHGAGEGAAWGDYNGDGWLDLFVPNYDGIKPGTAGEPDVLYKNNGNGTFTNVARSLGLNSPGYGFQGAWSDYDQDGDVDLLLTHDRGHMAPLFLGNKLYRNDGGVFTDVSSSTGFGVQLFSMGLACGDFDNDQDWDYYTTNIGSIVAPFGGANPLLVNNGANVFEEQSVLWGVDLKAVKPSTTSGAWWGCIFFDFDNDGWLDLLVNNQLLSDRLLRNTGTPPFVDITSSVGIAGPTGGPKQSFSSATSDIDNDGDLDLLVNHMGGKAHLYINHEGSERNWMKLRIAGVWPNLHAVGARSKIRTGAMWQMREVLAGANGYLGQNSLIQHYGVNEALIVDEVIVSWPGGAMVRTFTNVPTNQTWTIYPPPHLGDFNADSVVDLLDFNAFQSCFNQGLMAGYEMMDLDGDSFVDLDDFDDFLAVYAGSQDDCNHNGIVDLQEILLSPGEDGDEDGFLDNCVEFALADLNRDGFVDGADLGLLLGDWGGTGFADLNADGVVDGADLGLMLASWT